jgi:hypothetical protein
MPTESYLHNRAKALADLHEAVQDEAQLLERPEAHITELIEQAERAAAQGVIDGDDLREFKEWADSALASALG